jgi:nucleoside-diphosphate-sugar epimerase
MRLLVTGASGNVGTALLRRLAVEHPDWAIRGLVRRPPPPVGEYGLVEWYAHDLADETADTTARRAARGVDAVVHLAWAIQPARKPDYLEAVNVGGSTRVFDAVRAEGVPHLVHMSSVGAYSPRTSSRAVTESWPHGGVPTSSYSRHKVAAETALDIAPPAPVVTRLRPGLIFQGEAGSEIARYFLGPLVPRRALGRRLLPRMPLPRGLSVQAVHADDVADAIVRALERRALGAFNLAAAPQLGVSELGRALGAPPVELPGPVLRRAAEAGFRLHLQPTEPGWLDLALSVPVLDCRRAEEVLGWSPTWSSSAALAELVDGMRRQRGAPSPALRGGRR